MPKSYGVSISEDFKKPVMAVKKYAKPSRASINSAAAEMKESEPAIIGKTKKKFGKARAAKQKVAILLSKARKGK